MPQVSTPTEPARRSAELLDAAVRAALLAPETNHTVRLAPDGRSVVYVHGGEESPWVRTRAVDTGDDRVLAAFPDDAIGELAVSGDGRWVAVRRALRGSERWRVTLLDAAGDVEPVYETPPDTVVSQMWTSPGRPGVLMCCRSPQSPRGDLLRVAPEHGEVRLVARNTGAYRWIVDVELQPCGMTVLHPDGSLAVLAFAPGSGADNAREVMRVEPEAVPDFAVVSAASGGGRLWVVSSHGHDGRRLLSVDTGSARTTPLADLDVATYPMVGDTVWCDPVTGEPELTAAVGQRLELVGLTEAGRGLADALRAGPGVAVPLERDLTGARRLVARVRDDAPMGYAVLEPSTERTTPLFVNRPALVGVPLASLEDLGFVASDGRARTGYIMRPRHRPCPRPTVVLVHGGPASRDHWRFHAEAQFLASLGMASIHVNFAGSAGFGRAFRRLGHGGWGARMQDDLYEAVGHAVAEGVADPGRIAFFGASYGGYAALLAATARPDLVRCAVAISPPTDLVALTDDPPPFWRPLADALRAHVSAGTDGPLDRAELSRRSPRQRLSVACPPLLIAHGTRDPRVPVAQVDAFVEAARADGVTVDYRRFEDEGHHVKGTTNRNTLYTAIERFLGGHLS